ncbi:hypothetical protein A259_15016, partial [Pseudomonas syringae pv. actinidiae ICMP 19070]
EEEQVGAADLALGDEPLQAAQHRND